MGFMDEGGNILLAGDGKVGMSHDGFVVCLYAGELISHEV